MSSEEVDVAVVGRRSSSPPGRESREDWKGGERNTITDAPSDTKQTTTSRSRSRSPRSKSPAFPKDWRESREQRYMREGTNTNSQKPHLQRARLFVGNIEPDTTHRRDVIELFSRYGEVLGVSVHKGYAFVQMDRERSANRAINGEDNHMFKGSRIHVEFSQAALKAGAKFERISSSSSRESPPDDRTRSQPQPQPSSRSLHSSLTLLEIEREREERLSRILNMERELALLRAREENATARRPPTLSEPSSYDRYDRYEAYRSRERSPPPRRETDYPPMRDYSRSDRLGYEGARGDDRGGRSYYNGRSNSPISRGGGLGRDGFAGAASGGGGGVGDSYREPVSYPISGRGGYDHRENSSQLLGGSGGGNIGMGYGSRAGSGMGQSSINASVGYGGSSGGKLGMGGAPPPGWPSTDYDKSNANRPPFAWN